MDSMMTHDDQSAPAARKRSERTCAGCGKHAAAPELLRVVHDPSSGAIAIDLADSHFGRGAHLHPSPDCVAKAVKGGFARAFKAKVEADASALGLEIVSAADRRIEGLLTGARRAGQLAVGADVVSAALRDERADLVVVARDASAAARMPEVERAVASGKAIALGDKRRLGLLMNRDEVAVIAILHSGVAAAALQTYRMSGPFRGGVPASTDSRSEEAWSSSEVR